MAGFVGRKQRPIFKDTKLANPTVFNSQTHRRRCWRVRFALKPGFDPGTKRLSPFVSVSRCSTLPGLVQRQHC